MGRITEALKKVSDERITRILKKPEIQYVVKRVEDTKIDEHVVSFHDPTSPVGEQYKILRTNIQSLKSKRGYKKFLITSSVNSEGKTITSINLAIAMAQDLNNKSILLIDADMRKGRVAKYLGLDPAPGLSEVLEGKINEDSAFVTPGIDNLTIMVSGSVSNKPSELLGSKRMQTLLNSLESRFDYIFIDSPPVVPLTDACILAPMVDGAILVIQAARTQHGTIQHAQSRLHQAGAKILGIVMTNVEYHLPQYLYRYIQEYSEYK
ncbi:MAG: CpsD/CapB family tyrosine-protein kinase [Candidatus Omnitrophota bacterium]